jgi:hypothetical protein
MADPLIGNYRFRSGAERVAYNGLANNDEKWAYLRFAREKRADEDARVAGHPRRKHKYHRSPYLLMKQWRALPSEERHLLVEAAKTDANRPDAVSVVIEENSSLSPGSIDDFVDTSGQDMWWARNTHWRYVKTLYNRNNGYRKRKRTDNGLWSVVRLYVSVDDVDRVRDVSFRLENKKHNQCLRRLMAGSMWWSRYTTGRKAHQPKALALTGESQPLRRGSRISRHI